MKDRPRCSSFMRLPLCVRSSRGRARQTMDSIFGTILYPSADQKCHWLFVKMFRAYSRTAKLTKAYFGTEPGLDGFGPAGGDLMVQAMV